MKREVVMSLSIAISSLALVIPNSVQALGTNSLPDAQNTQVNAGATEATQMVRAEAVLSKKLDARKVQAGEQFQATLSEKVRLKDGTELPRGTELIGTVAEDAMQTSGTSSLALKFTQADLKNGKVIPIKATIVSVFPADNEEAVDSNFWTPDILQVDQESAMSGVDMHSKIADTNSGEFVSKKADVKLPEGFGIALAIGAPQGAQQDAAGSN
jgi:hypothetical protein